MNKEKHKTPKSQTTRIWIPTLKLLRKCYGETGEPQIKILDRLVREEWERIQKDKFLSQHKE